MLPWGAPLPLVGPVSGPPQWIVPLADDVVSNVATYDLVWTGDFAAVVVDVHNMLSVTNNVIAQIRTTGDGGATWDAAAGDYTIQASSISGNGSQSFTQNASNPNMAFHAGALQVSNVVAGEGLSATFTIPRPFDASHTELYGTGGYYSTAATPEAVTIFSGTRKALARVDGVRLYFTSGNIASARIRARGMIGYGAAA